MIADVLLVASLLGPAQSATTQPAVPAAVKPTPCAQALASGASGAAAELCLGEEQARLGETTPKGSVERSRRFEAAEQHFGKAEALAVGADARARALESLALLYDAQHLDEPGRLEGTLRELIALKPADLAPVFRLAKLQEDRGFIEPAEDTLLGARRRQPDSVEPYMKLAQFYSRRALAHTEAQKPARPPASGPAEKDESGVYRVGGAIAMPQRLDRPVYSPEAQAAGIDGVVIVEAVVNESGDVVDAKVVRSIPLLDEEAIRAVRNWRYKPTVVNGQPVPVRVTATINFTRQ